MNRAGLLVLAAALLAACAGVDHDRDYDRHRLSQVVFPPGGGSELFFDATVTSEYPEDDPAAEAKRMEWLAAWLKQRNACANGFDVKERRPFGFLEDNPARHSLRYEVSCR